MASKVVRVCDVCGADGDGERYRVRLIGPNLDLGGWPAGRWVGARAAVRGRA